MEVKAPNGDVYDLPDSVASGLIASHGSGWSEVVAKPAKKAAAKPPKN